MRSSLVNMRRRIYVSSFASSSNGRHSNRRRNATCLWQRGYFEHVLRDDEDTIGVARYIIENPVRAGLVTNPLDYPYLGSFTTTARELLYSVQIERT